MKLIYCQTCGTPLAEISETAANIPDCHCNCGGQVTDTTDAVTIQQIKDAVNPKQTEP